MNSPRENNPDLQHRRVSGMDISLPWPISRHESLKTKLGKDPCALLSGDMPWSIRAWRLKDKLHPKHMMMRQSSHGDVPDSRACLKGGRRTGKNHRKPSLVVRNSEALQGTCPHRPPSRRVCAWIGSCWPWTWPPWVLNSVFERSLPHRLKRLILKKWVMLVAEYTSQWASCPRKAGSPRSFWFWTILVPFSPCLWPLSL